MPIINPSPTPYPEVNAILSDLFARVQAVLGGGLIGMYLDGSLASGDFDQDSDIDFVAVTAQDVSGPLFLELQAMHDRLALGGSPYAHELEGSYLSRHALRRHDPQHVLHPNIERGAGERLKMAEHNTAWNIHRWVLRERGIILAGPPPQTLVDPVPPEDLRAAMQPLLTGWLPHFLNQPQAIGSRGYQSYIVLSICRMLYTLQVGGIASKPEAARWFIAHGGERWQPLIERAWVGRHHSQGLPEPEDLRLTLDFIRDALEKHSPSFHENSLQNPTLHLNIRSAGPEDAALLAALGAETFADTFAAQNTPDNMAAYLAEAFSLAKQAGELADPASRFLIAEVDGTPAGYARVLFGPSPAGVSGQKPMEIARFYARKAWIGQGIGARLMQACLLEAQTAGCDVVWLDVWELNPRAVAFYRKWGFERVGSQPFKLGGDLQSDLLMARPLHLELPGS